MKRLELMVLLNTEVWDIAEDYQRASILMCLVHRIPATETNKTDIMDRNKAGNPWVECEKEDGTVFYKWVNSIENVLGDNGQVLIPGLIAAAQSQITRPDTKMEIGFDSNDWFEFWGIVEPSQSSSSSSS